MSDEIILTPTIKTRKKVDKSMIGVPTDFRHLAHVGEKTEEEKSKIKTTNDVIGAANQTHYYQRPISSTSTSVRSILKKERLGLDHIFPAPDIPEESTNIRGYVNHPTSHTYQNIIVGARPSTKKYQAPPPPPRATKPKLIPSPEESQPVVFRQVSNTNLPVEAEQPKISTPDVIVAPKPNSMIIERPDILMNFDFRLDSFIPVSNQNQRVPSPLFQPINLPAQETPILCSPSPPEKPSEYDDTSYMSTIRSTSAQGKEILDDLDDWLDQLDEFDREKLSTISTDESGYPTMASAQDREFMRFLVDKYSLGVEPETIKVRKGPPALSSKKNYAPIPSFSSSSESRPRSLPPDRPPPSYDTPSYEAPTSLLKSKNYTKQDAIDLSSTVSSGTVPEELSHYFEDNKKWRRTSMLGTISSDITDFSTTSSRYEQPYEDDILSNVSEEDIVPESAEAEDQDYIPIAPIPMPRTRKVLSNSNQEATDENCNDKTEGMDIKTTEKENHPEVKSEEEEEDETFVCRF